jgi:hypothetical protein
MKPFIAKPSPEGPPPLTFPDILSDPLVRAVMAADHVDPQILRVDLGQIARMLPARARIDSDPCCGKAC